MDFLKPVSFIHWRASMCDPITLLLAASAGSTAVSAIQQNKMHRFQAAQAEADADTAEQAAEIKADKIREKAKRTAASFRSALGASGVSVDSVSANKINQTIIRDAELDALIGVYDAEDAATKLRTQASLDRIKGNNAIIGGAASGAATAITAGSQLGWFKGE